MNELKIEIVDLKTSQRLEVEGFLSAFRLLLDKDVEYTIVVKNQNEIVGTCSCAGNIIKSFAVKEALQGEGIASKVITHITNYLFEKGVYENFILTSPKNINIFKELNYHIVHRVDQVALLEGGMANIKRYTERMLLNSGLNQDKKAALVMNCNPFTLGHRYLIETAANENEVVVVFIVEENRSLFPFNIRMELVKRGTADLANVHILPGGSYIISSNTFPSYFLRKEEDRMNAYIKLDAGIFGEYIAPQFNIKKRYVGTEPYCQVTRQYNQGLLNTLPNYGIKVVEIDRLNLADKVISASEVRRLIRTEDWDQIKEIVPRTTYEFLRSPEGIPIIDKIKRSDSPH